MNKKLQKIILGIIKEKGGEASFLDISHDNKTLEYWMDKEKTSMDDCCHEYIRFHDDVSKDGKYYHKINNQIRLLIDMKKIGENKDNGYSILLGGFHQIDHWYMRFGRFILFGKHNLLAVLSLLLSLAALVISVVVSN